ncbi:MAG: BTAD domain-containing putative transcriptional regulator [Actinomycetota bacterium]
MEFRVLGPLEAEDHGRVIALEGPAERRLLALLVCLSNEAVSVGRIIDELWGEEPPPTARNMVQRYVSRLRRALGDADSTRLATEFGGYRLRVGEQELDWFRFESTVIRARDREEPDAAVALFKEALGLWRGSPFGGANDGLTVAAERIRMDEAYLATLEECNDRDLDLGHHHELVSELGRLCRQHPLRERFRAQLMVALYRCDRQAEALRSFAEYQQHLGEETGLEPSAELTRLENQIVVGSRDLDLPKAESLGRHTNLPQRLATFVGRDREAENLARLLAEFRLVTLTGVGGIGKTSLAVRVAAEAHDMFRDGVWLVDFSPVAESSLIDSTAASVLGIHADLGEHPIDALTRRLAEQNVLIVLDNCEHLVEGLAEFARTLLRATRNVHVLATSREALSVTGEAILRVPPLEVPDVAQHDPVVIADAEAVILFTDRARLLRPEFGIDSSNAAEVAEICRRLDGIPLAIELAAARLGTMGLHKIVAGVENRYHLLTRGSRTAPHRHQTLQALVDWSHDLLTDDERTLFRRLAVFAGTFTSESAQQVCGFEPLTPAIVLDVLDQLVDASLVIPPDPSVARYRMLQTIREYASRHLDAQGETDDTMRRLAVFLIKAGPDTRDGFPGSDHLAWYRWRHEEQDNFRAVLAWSVEAGDADMASLAAIEFRGYLSERQLFGEAVTWTDAALALFGDEPNRHRLQLLLLGVAMDADLGRRIPNRAEVRSLHGEAEALGDDTMMGWARLLEAMVAYQMGDTGTALDLITEAIEHQLKATDPRMIYSLWFRAFYATRLGRYEEARLAANRIVSETARLGERGDLRYATYSANVLLALTAVHEGDLDDAERLLGIEHEYSHQFGPGELYMYLVVRSFLAIACGDTASASTAAAELSDAALETAPPSMLRDAAELRALSLLDTAGFQAALPHLCEALEHARRAASVIDTADVVVVVAEAALEAGDHEEAVLLLAASSAIHEGSGIVLFEWEQRRHGRSVRALRTALGDARFDTLWAEGSALSPTGMLDDAICYVDAASAPSV